MDLGRSGVDLRWKVARCEGRGGKLATPGVEVMKLIILAGQFSSSCAKLRENPEDQGFTFFAFLPPYFGVSGSLVHLNR